jgi:hypothetical protein
MENTKKKTNPEMEKSRYMSSPKKTNTFKTPDLREMQEVIINERTKIYIAIGADPEKARSRYFERLETAGKMNFSYKKPAAKT